MNNLASYRAGLGLTQEQMAERLHVSRAHLSKLESGAACPSRKLMLRIEQATGGAVPVVGWFHQDNLVAPHGEAEDAR